MKLPCLSVNQPYAWLIAAGIKGYENRGRVFPRTGTFWVHATKKPVDPELIERVEDAYGIWLPGEFELGAIVGQGHIIRAVYSGDRLPNPEPWRIKDSAGYLLDKSKSKLIHPVPLRGQQGWYWAEVNDPRWLEKPKNITL